MSSRKRSVAWTFFKKSTKESTLAECILCGVRVAHTNTSNLLEHLRGKHRGETSELCYQELNPEVRRRCLDEQSSNTTKQCPKMEHVELNLDSDTIIQCEETSDHLDNDELDIELERKRLDESTTGSIKLDSTGARKCRSVVWMCFEKSGDDAASAVCTLCGKSIRQVCGSTSNLLKHLLNKHPIEHESIVSDRSLTISCESFPVEKESPVVGRCSGLKRRSRSILWEYFMKNSADESQVICSFCGRMLKQPIGSTSNLIKHLYAKHREEYQKLYPNENLAYDAPVAKSEALELHSKGMQMQYVELDERECADHKEGQDDENEEDKEEEDDGGEVDASIPELFTRVQHIWLKHCDEREKEFVRFMTTKRNELLQLHESMQKLQQQMAVVSKDVRLQESKRKVELKRQERMDRQFLTQKEANARKQKYGRTFRQACNLVKGIQYDQTSLSNPVATGKETKAYEDLANEVNLGSENLLIESCIADTVASETDAMDTIAMEMDTAAASIWPVSSFTQHSTSGSNEGQVVILPPNKTESNGWTCNTITRASKRQKIKSETIVDELKQDCNKWC